MNATKYDRQFSKRKIVICFMDHLFEDQMYVHLVFSFPFKTLASSLFATGFQIVAITSGATSSLPSSLIFFRVYQHYQIALH